MRAPPRARLAKRSGNEQARVGTSSSTKGIVGADVPPLKAEGYDAGFPDDATNIAPEGEKEAGAPTGSGAHRDGAGEAEK